MWRFHKKGIKLHFFVSGSLLDGKQRHRLVHVLGHVLGMQSLLDRLVEELLGAQAMVARSRQILERVLQQKGNDVLDRIQFASDEAYYQFGVFGKLRRVAVENYAQDEQLLLDHWFWQKDRSGGILIEHAVHFIDLVHFISPSKYKMVNGLKHNRNAFQEDQIMANVLYENGLIATHYHSFARPGFFETTDIKLSFDIADIQLHGWIPLTADVKVLVNGKSKEMLLSNPLFECINTESIDNLTDESRPKGWGINGQENSKDKHIVKSGGVSYEAAEMITGRFSIGATKQEVYANCVKLSLLDVLQKVSNPSYSLMAGLESGLDSLKIAELATVSARSNA